ncbi:response regulator transcription factor [Neobacillus vireti]|uniref:response regulator transcription factor n=1 Tax=Neobacillus vireti TaxID=220686 RepID=UPI002FFE236B
MNSHYPIQAKLKDKFIKIEKKVREIEEISNHEEQLQSIVKTYIEIFPVKNAHLYRYSPLGFIAEGLICLTEIDSINISTKRDDLRVAPGILSALQERRAKYYTGLDYIKQMGTRYIYSHESGLIVPITFNTVALGYIGTTDFRESPVFDEELLSLLTYYGKLVGRVIYSSMKEDDPGQLSNRELEIMRRISYGETTSDMADSMGISELTVKQYVKTALRKLGVQNRTHAVSELFRRGILS